MNLTRILLSGVALAAAAPVYAQILDPVSITCNSSGQVCSPAYSNTFNLPSPGVASLTFTASTGGCSNAQFLIQVDGSPATYPGSSNPFLAPGQSITVTTPSLAAGLHTVSVQATGQVGGCNLGNLVSWAGSLNISAAGLAATPAPTTGLLIGLGIVSLAVYRSRERLAGLLAR